MLNFHLEAVDIFVSHYDIEGLINLWKLSTTCTRGRDLRRRIREALPSLREHFSVEGDTLRDLVENVYKMEFDKVSSLYSHSKWVLSHFAEKGNWSMILYTMKRGFTDLNVGLRGAARGGWMDVVEFFLEKGAGDYYSGITGAVSGSYPNMEEFFRKKLEQDGKYNTNTYTDACTFGLMEKNCQQDPQTKYSALERYSESYDTICGLAIVHGDIKLIDYLITDKGVEFYHDPFSCILYYADKIAIKTDKIVMLNYLLGKSKQSRIYFDLTRLLALAIEQDERELFFYIYRECFKDIRGSELPLAVLCVELDRMELLSFYTEKDLSLDWCMKRAIVLGKIKAIYILSKVCKNFNLYMIQATEVNNVELVRYFCSKGSRTHELCLDHALRCNYTEIVHYFQVERYA